MVLKFYDNFILIMYIPLITNMLLNRKNENFYYLNSGILSSPKNYVTKVRYSFFLNFIILISWSFILIILKLTLGAYS